MSPLKRAAFVHRTYVPGWSASSPCSRLLRLKSVGWYLGFCQIHGRLRLTTSAMGTSFLESLTRETGMRLPSGSIWWTKFAVALENITLADRKWQSWKKDKCHRFWFLFFSEDRGWVLLFKNGAGFLGDLTALWPQTTLIAVRTAGSDSWGVGEVFFMLTLIQTHTHTHAPGSAFIV